MKNKDAKSLYRKLFVLYLHKKNQMFHFDDDPHEILFRNTDAPLFTPAEASRIKKIRDWLYDEELFEIALELDK